MDIDKCYMQVREFHRAFDLPRSEDPILLSPDRVDRRAKWMAEEVKEFTEAGSIPEQIDAVVDILYLALGTLAEMGVAPNDFFQIVHEANMSKLWNGRPRLDSDGKVMKPPGWVGPEKKIELVIKSRLNSRALSQD